MGFDIQELKNGITPAQEAALARAEAFIDLAKELRSREEEFDQLFDEVLEEHAEVAHNLGVDLDAIKEARTQVQSQFAQVQTAIKMERLTPRL